MQRAIALEDKELRRKEILRAADAELDIHLHELPSVSRIALRAGLAKGTIYLYFRTKEEIYLALLAEGLAIWVDVVCTALKTKDASGELIIGRYVRFCAKNPRLLYLASMAPVILERNVTYETALQFKTGVAQGTDVIARLMSQRFPMVTVDTARRLFLHTFALTTGLWQHAHPPPVIEKVYQQPGLSGIRMEFENGLLESLTALWSGTIEPRREAS